MPRCVTRPGYRQSEMDAALSRLRNGDIEGFLDNFARLQYYARPDVKVSLVQTTDGSNYFPRHSGAGGGFVSGRGIAAMAPLYRGREKTAKLQCTASNPGSFGSYVRQNIYGSAEQASV